MQESHEILRPASLKSENDYTDVDDEMRASFKRAAAALEWQGKQIEHLQGVSKDDDVAYWPIENINDLLARAEIVSKDELEELDAPTRTALAVDFAKVLRIFDFMFANMPDDDEAKEISAADNIRMGYPPPSPPPPPPPGEPPPMRMRPLEPEATAPSRAAPPKAPSRRKRKRRPRDEL